jgi:hypothetical protein
MERHNGSEPLSVEQKSSSPNRGGDGPGVRRAAVHGWSAAAQSPAGTPVWTARRRAGVGGRVQKIVTAPRRWTPCRFGAPFRGPRAPAASPSRYRDETRSGAPPGRYPAISSPSGTARIRQWRVSRGRAALPTARTLCDIKQACADSIAAATRRTALLRCSAVIGRHASECCSELAVCTASANRGGHRNRRPSATTNTHDACDGFPLASPVRSWPPPPMRSQ